MGLIPTHGSISSPRFPVLSEINSSLTNTYNRHERTCFSVSDPNEKDVVALMVSAEASGSAHFCNSNRTLLILRW